MVEKDFISNERKVILKRKVNRSYTCHVGFCREGDITNLNRILKEFQMVKN